MTITEIRENKKKYLDLLLLADEEEDMIDRYIENAQNNFINPDEIIELERVELNINEFEKIKQGQFLLAKNSTEIEKFVKLVFENNLVAIGLKTGNIIKPKTVLVK